MTYRLFEDVRSGGSSRTASEGQHDGVSIDYTLSQELLWMWHGDNSETQEGECPLLEAGTRGLIRRQETEKTQCVCSEL
jgi:hypothetical protein